MERSGRGGGRAKKAEENPVTQEENQKWVVSRGQRECVHVPTEVWVLRNEQVSRSGWESVQKAQRI